MARQRETSGNLIAACGTAATADKLAHGLVAAGLKARAFALVALAVRPDWHSGLNMDDYDWIVVSSPTAANLVVDALRGMFTGKFACVGETTAAVIKEAGFSVAIVPGKQNRKGLLGEMAGQTKGKRVLLPLSDASPPELREGLTRLGFHVDAPVVYANRCAEPVLEDFKRALAGGELVAAGFTAASAVNYAAVAPGLEKLRLYCIGPSTCEAVWERKWKVAGMPDHHSVGGLVKTIVEGERRE